MTTSFELSHAVHKHPRQAEFWRLEIAAGPEPTVLPRDRLGAATNRPLATVDASHAGASAELARVTRDDPTLATVFCAAVLAVVTARATDTSTVSMVVAGPRGRHAFPLTFKVDGATTFRELLSRARTDYLRVAAHTDIPVGFLFSQAESTPGDVALAVDTAIDPTQTDQFGSTLRFEVRTSGPHQVRLTYREDLFTPATAARLTHAFARLMTSVTEDIDTSLSSLLAVSADEQSSIGEFNDTAAEFPRATPLHEFLQRQAARTPDRVAVLDDGTTYGELNRRANQLARRLQAEGVGRGDVVVVCLPRSPLELTAIYAVLKVGAAYLPIDRATPPHRLDHMLRHSGTTVVLADHGSAASVPAGVTVLNAAAAENFTGDGSDLAVPVSGNDLCYVIYTSGSTGRPKGVMIQHRAIVNRLTWMQRAYPLSEDDVVLHKTPYTFDVSVWEIFWWTLAGAAGCTLPSGDERDPERIVARIAECGVTVTHFVPSMLQPFLRFAEVSGVAGQLASLRRVFSSGEPLRTGQPAAFTRVLGEPHGATLVNLYGPTEAAVDVTHFDCAGVASDRPVPIGRPIDNVRISILTKAGAVAPIGTPGELCIAGTGLALGYLNAGKLTSWHFRPDLDVPGGRLYRTGDLARWLPDGTIEFLGRADRQVKIRGHRIEPAEIEHVIAKAGVLDCAVVAVADGTGGHRLCAYVVPGTGFREEALHQVIEDELPAFMHPASIVTVEAIPTTVNGKRDLTSLPRPALGKAGSDYAAPRTDLERQLADIWAQALGGGRVGTSDNFFELGGDSITFIAVLAAARASGLQFSFQDLFARPTVAELAAHVAATGAHRPELPRATAERRSFALLDPGDRERLPAGTQDAFPLSTLQAGLLYETALPEGGRLYHDVVSYLVPDGVDSDAFTSAVGAVAQRHAIFRTSFHPTGFAEPIQIVHDSAPLPLRIVDLTTLTPHEQDAELGEFHERELSGGFRAGAVDLVRVRLHLLGERGCFYSLSYHAAALDGWSVSTIHRDIFTTYFALRDGRQPELPSYDGGYAEFVQLERDATGSTAHREFWQRLLADADSTRLPRWAGSRPAKPLTVRMYDVSLPSGLSGRVIATAAQLGVPVKSVLLAAHVAVLSFVAGTDDVLTGYEQSGRPEVAGGELIPGLFLNTVPLRVRLGRQSWAGLVHDVFDAEAELLPYRRYPLAEMTRQTGTRGGLFDTVFNFTHFHVLKEVAVAHGLELARAAAVTQTEFPFRAEFWQDAFTDEVGLSLHYHEQVFATMQIERIGGYYVRALDLLTTRTDEDHRARTLLREPELALLTKAAMGPLVGLPSGTVLDLFAGQVRRAPERIAVSEGDDGLTYADLAAQSELVAVLLESSGVGHGDVVAVVMDRGLPWAVCVLAIFKLGAVYLPQEPADPAERRAAALRQCGCRHVLCAGEYAGRVAAEVAGFDGAPVVLRYEDASFAPPRPLVARPPTPYDLAYIIFTSGTTGVPKGASISHLGMLNHLQAKIGDLDLGRDDRIAQVTTQCFDISVWQLLAAWLVGGQTVIVPADVVTDPTGFLDLVRERSVTILEIVPSYLDILLSEVEDRYRPLPSLRYNLITGEALPPPMTTRWFSHYRIPLVNAYGPTEASDDVTHYIFDGPVAGDRVPVGRPIINTGVHVLGPDDRVLPIGSFGEICVTGMGVGPGYFNDPAATAAVFGRNHLDGTSATLYRTGDIGRWLPDGVLDCAGRTDFQVKVRGIRIELSEIESALARLPGVEHAVVLAHRSEPKTLIVAYLTGPAELDIRSVRSGLASWLPNYMLPDAVVWLAAFPLTRNGKVDRSALADMDVSATAGGRREPPADRVEAELLELFADVLGLPSDLIGVLDNFFDIGGHSLAAIRVVSRLRDRIALRDLLASPTVRSLAGHLRDSHPTRRDLLTDLTEATGHPVPRPAATLVCVPFAGGRAVSYLPLARALHTTGGQVRVLGVELPARTRDDVRAEAPADRVAVELAGEIAETAVGDVVLLGHSAGSAIALLTALELRRRGHDGTHLLIVSQPLTTSGVSSSDEDDEDVVRRLLATGMADLERLSRPERADITSAFRYDATQASNALAGLVRDPRRHPLPVALTVVLAKDDPVTGDPEQTAARWAALAGDVRLVVADGGGHYLNTSRPALLAACVLDALDRRYGGHPQAVIGGAT